MKLFARYIKQRKRVIAAFLSFCAVFAVSFRLYGLAVRAVIYPALLCAALGAVFAAADFIRVLRKHRRLCEIRELSAEMIPALPDIESIDDEDYRDIIKSLQIQAAELSAAAETRYQDAVEYYTVWVHQIKTPIASMRLSLEGEDTPAARRLSSDLLRIEQYVEMVMAFLRLDSPTSDYVFREHSIDDIVKQSVKKFAAEFIGRKIKLEYSPIQQTVITDDKWLSFVIEQVLSNALKYTREGSVRIYMTEPKTLCVEDTGIGIAPEDLPRVFEKGYTGYNGRSDKKASGIGLYLCKRICGNLGAGISAQSEVGKGTVIRIDLRQYKLKKE